MVLLRNTVLQARLAILDIQQERLKLKLFYNASARCRQRRRVELTSSRNLKRMRRLLKYQLPLLQLHQRARAQTRLGRGRRASSWVRNGAGQRRRRDVGQIDLLPLIWGAAILFALSCAWARPRSWYISSSSQIQSGHGRIAHHQLQASA